MRSIVLPILLLFPALPAFANDEAARIGRQAQTCWMIPSNLIGKKLSATLAVTLDTDGNVAAITVSDTPQGKDGEAFVTSAKRAIQRCAPYKNVSRSALIVHFNAE